MTKWKLGGHQVVKNVKRIITDHSFYSITVSFIVEYIESFREVSKVNLKNKQGRACKDVFKRFLNNKFDNLNIKNNLLLYYSVRA